MIESYSFGKIQIDGTVYTADVLIFTDHVEDNWRRREGHKLVIKDIEAALHSGNPEHIVVGTGKFGIMKIDAGLKNYLSGRQIALHAAASPDAVQIYNDLAAGGEHVLGAFHLTC